MGTCRFLPAAEQDLEDIHRHTVAEFGPQQARRYLAGLRKSLSNLAVFPNAGVEAARGSGLRVWHYVSHRVVYRPHDDGITVGRVLHAARDVDLVLAHYAAERRAGD